MLWWLAMAAGAQSKIPGISDNPDYVAYNEAVTLLWSTELGPPYSKIGPATTGTLWIGAKPIGRMYSITDAAPGAPHYIDTAVIWSGANIDLMNLQGFTIFHLDNIADTPAAVQDELVELEDQNGPDPTKGAGFQAAEMEIRAGAMPTAEKLGDPDLLAITPEKESHIRLWCFELEQAGVNQGWLLREEHDDGASGTQVRDHWFFRLGYDVVNQLGELVTVLPQADHCTDIPTFVAAFGDVVQAEGGNSVNRYHTTEYRYVPLAELTP